jgi:hypothetical protein
MGTSKRFKVDPTHVLLDLCSSEHGFNKTLCIQLTCGMVIFRDDRIIEILEDQVLVYLCWHWLREHGYALMRFLLPEEMERSISSDTCSNRRMSQKVAWSRWISSRWYLSIETRKWPCQQWRDHLKLMVDHVWDWKLAFIFMCEWSWTRASVSCPHPYPPRMIWMWIGAYQPVHWLY